MSVKSVAKPYWISIWNPLLTLTESNKSCPKVGSPTMIYSICMLKFDQYIPKTLTHSSLCLCYMFTLKTLCWLMISNFVAYSSSQKSFTSCRHITPLLSLNLTLVILRNNWNIDSSFYTGILSNKYSMIFRLLVLTIHFLPFILMYLGMLESVSYALCPLGQINHVKWLGGI